MQSAGSGVRPLADVLEGKWLKPPRA
jgi:hypothetical protein